MTFLSYSIVVTIIGIAYFTFIIGMDLFGKKNSKKTEEEEIDNSDMEAPTMIGGDEEEKKEEDESIPTDLVPEEGQAEDAEQAEAQAQQTELIDDLKQTQENDCDIVHPQYQEMLPSEAFRVMMCQPSFKEDNGHLVINRVRA